MTPERWKAIEALFEECLALAPVKRRALLDRHGHGEHGQDDRDLVREVEALLEQEQRTDRLDAVLQAPARAAIESLGAFGPGDRVGAYRLERLLGEGGMGKVFLARRDDDQFHQQVAIKLLPPGASARGLTRRFLAERQILARLEHPHIARLLDGGSTDDGQPFLVMEYVDGEAFIRHCDRRYLGIRERLQLFQKVASAVAHAHRHLIVHRDIKPANILIHEETGPKLLDFGIAKILQRDDEANTADLTQRPELLLTPDYASPEQILGEPVTTLSDVYSLGVVLFELLTGDQPRRFQSLTQAERAHEVTNTSPPRPSTQVGEALANCDDRGDVARRRGLRSSQLRRRLAGDLDTIVLRALDVEPTRRYGSVAELSADIDRFLRDEPVLARPDTWRYCAGKMVRRHPWGTAAVATIVLLLVSLAMGLNVHANRVGTERDRAVAAETEAKTVSKFLVALFEVADPAESRGETVTARELLDRGSDLIETQLADEPQVQASLLATLGDVHLNLGLRRQAEDLHRRALEQRLDLLGDTHPDTAYSRDRLGDTLRQISRLDDAEAQLRQGLATREARLPADDPAVADSLNNLGLLLAERGQFEAAEPLLRRGFDIRLARLGADHRDTDVSRMNLGQLLMETRRFNEASMYLEAVLPNRQARLGTDHPKVANTVHMLATLRHRQGAYVAAEALFGRALRIRRAVLPPGHPHIASSLNNLATLLHDQWRLGEAEHFYREAIEINRHDAGGDAIGLAININNLGSLLEDLGRYDEAEALYRESMAIRKGIQGENSKSYRRMVSKLGRLAVRAGDLERAEKLLVETEAWYEESLVGDEPDRIRNFERLALLRRAQGDVATSSKHLGDALDSARRTYGPKHAILAELQAEFAITLAQSSEPRQCQSAVDAARVMAARIEATDITRGQVALAAGLCARANGNTAEADDALQQAVSLLRPSLGPQNHWVRAAEDG